MFGFLTRSKHKAPVVRWFTEDEDALLMELVPMYRNSRDGARTILDIVQKKIAKFNNQEEMKLFLRRLREEEQVSIHNIQNTFFDVWEDNTEQEKEH